MIDIIKYILQENKYQLIKKADIFYFFKNNSENREDYYLIYNLDSYENIDKLNEKIKQSETVFDDMRDYSGSVEKNTTALYLLKTNKKIDTLTPLWHRICEIEEIVTYMKRNVLCYTENEQIELNKVEGSFTNDIRGYLMTKENFSTFKKDGDLRYEILSKIFIKIHCLKYKFDSNNFPDLEQDIKSEIIKKYDKQFSEDLEYIFTRLDEVIQKKVSEDKLIDNYIQKFHDNVEIKSIEDLANETILKRLQR